MTGFSFLANASLPAATRAPVTQDNSIILLDSESGLNHGKKPMIRIKGNQHIVALGFDAELLKGKKVARATLVCRKGSQDIGGVTISTIQAPWDELKSNARTSGSRSLG